MMAYLEDYGQILLIPQILRGRELLDHLRAMEAYVLRAFSIDNLVIIPMRDHCRYLDQFSNILLCILILSQYDLHFSFSVHRLVSHGMSSLVPIGNIRGLILIWGCLWIELLSDSELLFCAFHQMAGHRTDYCASLHHTIQDLIDSGAVSFPVSTTDTDLGPDMTADSFLAYSTHAIPPPSGLYHHTLLSSYFARCTLVSLSDIVVFLEYIEIRLLQLRFTMSDEIAPSTLTTLYEMMVDLTRRIERIELILSEYPSSSRGAPGVVMPSLPHFTSPISVTLGASHPRPRPHSVLQQHSSSITLATSTRPPSQLWDPPVIIVP
ncbi:hypothetical protein AAG906_018633 [Vitis piasezkii]